MDIFIRKAKLFLAISPQKCCQIAKKNTHKHAYDLQAGSIVNQSLPACGVFQGKVFLRAEFTILMVRKMNHLTNYEGFPF